MSLKSFWLKFLSSVACLALLAACDQAAAAYRNVTPSTSPQTATVETPNVPPPATLEIDGQIQTASLGSYCWQDSHRQQSCTTVEGTLTPHDPLLAVDTPFTGHFHFSLPNPPESLILSMRPVLPYDDITGGSGTISLWRSTNGWAGEMPLKVDFEYQFMEGPSLYVISLAANWKDFGNVTYGFLVQVGPEKTYLPTSTPGEAYVGATPRSLQELSPQTRLGKGGVQFLLVSPDGHLLAISTSLGVYMIKTADQTQLWFRQFENKSVNLAFSPDGRQLAVGLTGSRMPILDSQTGQTLMELSGEEGIHGLWSPDGRFILTSGQCEQVVIWDAHTAAVIHELYPVRCNNATPGYVDAAWSWDGKEVYVSLGPTGQVSAWDVATYEPLPGYVSHPPEHAWGAVPVSSPTQDLFALNNGNTVSIMDGKTGLQVKQLVSDGSAMGLYDIHWSPDGKRLLAENYLWDVGSGRLLLKLDGFTKLAWLVATNAVVGVNYNDGSIQAVSLDSGKTLFTLAGFLPEAASPPAYWENDSLYTFYPNMITRWDPVNGQPVDQKKVPQGPAAALPADYSPDGSRLVVWPGVVAEASSRQELVHLAVEPSHGRDINAWSPDGSRIVSGDSLRQDPTVVWDAATGKIDLSLSLQAPGDLVLTSLAWSPNGTWIAEAGSLMGGSGFDDGMIALWDARTGAQTHLLMEAMSSERVQSIAWSHDGHWLAAGMYSGRIVLWDMQKFIPVTTLTGHTEIVNSLRWSPDDSLLASSSSDGTVLLWKIH